MTAETHVHEEVEEVSTNSKASVEIQGDQCALDVSSYQDSPKLPVPDCNGNGISHHDENGIARDDAEDNSYVFVSGNDDLLPIDSDFKGNAQVFDDSKGVEVHNGEFLNSSASGVDSSRGPEGTEVASSQNCSGDKCYADALQVTVIGEAAEQNGRVGSAESLPQQLEDHQIDPKFSLTAEENQECEAGVLVSGADSADKVSPEIALDVSKPIAVNLKSQENNFESTSEFGGGQESQHACLDATLCKSSEVGILESGAASVGNLELEPEIALDVVESIDFNQKSRENNLESTRESGEGQESQYAGLEVTPCGSSEVEVSNRNEAQQNPESSDELGGTQDSQNMHSDSAKHASPQTEVQMVNTEEQSDTESTSIMEVRVESEIPVYIPEQSGSYHVDYLNNDGEKLEEERKTQPPSDAKENQETVIILAENGGSDLDPGLKIEKSADEVDLPSETETACSPVLNENNFPVSSVNDSVPETKESIEHIDDSEKSLKLQQSSEGTDSLTHVADSYVGEKPVESDENVLGITREHEAEDKDSPSIENVPANTYEINKDEMGDPDGVAVEIVENAPGFSREHGTECTSSCLTDAATVEEVIEQEIEYENSVAGNVEGAIPSPGGNSKSDTKTIKDVTDTNTAGDDSTSCSANRVTSIMEFELETLDPEEEVATFQSDDVHLNNEGSFVDAEHADVQSVPSEAKKEFEVKSSSGISSRDMPCNDTVTFGIDVSDCSVIKDVLPNCAPQNVDVESKGEHLSVADLNSDGKLICQESKDVENSSTDAVTGRNVVLEPLTRPFHFLIRIPRFEDLKMKEQIRKAQLLVEEKTQHRDAFRIEVQKYKANCLGHAAEYDAAVSESRALKRSVKAKRAEIDSLQSVINKVKNAISVEDIDSRIYSMEHMIEHETLPLKEEKLFIREIKQLKQLREQLSSNLGSQDEVQQALNNRDQIEERLKVLKKELDSLKDSVLKADAVVRAIEKKYEDENKMVKEVQTQYAAANDVRQEAYVHLQSLRKQLFEKNQQFHMYKDNMAAARDYAAKRDREALHHLCVNQVDSFMELWNKNVEFRKDYVRCNMKSTLRRLGTLDGRSLGPDEQPPVFNSYGDERVDQLASSAANSSSILQTQHLEQVVVKPVESVTAGDETTVEESDPKSPTSSRRKQGKPILRSGLATVSDREITHEIREEHTLTEEELELARKFEERRKEEAAAMLKEQHRLEERVKAMEAAERKKRNAEKAQMRAELRAQKEAEQREKEREKRLRKKERKKAITAEVPDVDNYVETAPKCERLTETIEESENKENPPVVSKRPQKPSQFTKQIKAKSIPPPFRNRNRRKMQQWTWVILICLFVIALFLLGNVGFFSNLSSLRP